MPSAATLSSHVEAALATKMRDALSPCPRSVRPVTHTSIAALDEVLEALPAGAITEITGAKCSSNTSFTLSFLSGLTPGRQSGRMDRRLQRAATRVCRSRRRRSFPPASNKAAACGSSGRRGGGFWPQQITYGGKSAAREIGKVLGSTLNHLDVDGVIHIKATRLAGLAHQELNPQ